MKSGYTLAGLLACLVITFALPSAAQTVGPDGDSAGGDSKSKSAQEAKKATDLSLEELADVEVYSASKHLQRTSEAPSSVTVITRDEIQEYGYRTLAEILNSVRGFYITYDRNYYYLGVRGFGRLGDWNSRILVMIDGHRINNNVYDQALLGYEFPLDVDLIERVEVVPGPGSALYGSNAFFAVINVITRKPAQMKGIELSVEPGSYGTYGGRATYGGNFKGVEMLFSGGATNSAGQNLFFREFDTPANNNGVAVNADGFDDVHALAVFGYRGLTVEVLFGSRDKHIPTAAFGNEFNDPRFQAIDDQAYLNLTYQHVIAGKWQLFARTSWDDTSLTAPQAPPLPGGGVANDDFFVHGDWWTGELRLSRNLAEKHTLTFGTEDRDNVRQKQQFYIAPTNTTFLSAPSGWIDAIYAQDEFAITSKLTLNAGVRYDHYYDVKGSTNPRLGLIYHPWTRTSVKMLYGTAFRAPSPFELSPVAGGTFEANPNLVPETVRTMEGVVEQQLGRRFQLSGDVFQNRIKNLITSEFDSSAGLLVYRNAQMANATGVEAEFQAQWARDWRVVTSFTYTDADDGSPADLKLPNSPRHMAKLNLIAPLAWHRLFAGLDAQYTGIRYTLTNQPLGSFPIFNLTLLTHALGNRADFSASLYNALNRQYSDPGRPEDAEGSIQQDGRNFRVKMTVRF